jgi:hypothetical protein
MAGRASSLAVHAGPTKSFLVSLLICLSHTFFFYAQLSGKDCGPPVDPGLCPQHTPLSAGGLLQATIDVDVEYDAAGLLKTGLETLAQEECFQKGKDVECKEGRHAKSTELCSILECRGLEYEDILLHVSYLYSITRLWNTGAPYESSSSTSGGGDDASARVAAATTNSAMSPLVYPGRPAAALLFFWSFLWPHVKLLLLHLFFYLPLKPGLRRNGNYWLAFFGKWSLTDVLVMACVLALFNLDVDMSLVSFWAHLEPGFPQLCDAVCLTSYNASIANIDFGNRSQPLPASNCSTGCMLARTTLHKEVTPQELPQSDLHVNLKMEGLVRARRPWTHRRRPSSSPPPTLSLRLALAVFLIPAP